MNSIQYDENGISMGYVEPGHGYKVKQCWLRSDEDLQEMYSTYSGKKEILMWCYLPGKQSKRPQPVDQSAATSAKHSRVVESNMKIVSEVQEIVAKLQSKHGTIYTPEQYHEWAQLIQMRSSHRRMNHHSIPSLKWHRNDLPHLLL